MTSEMVQTTIDHIRANREEYLEGFKELLRIPSISTDPAHSEDIRRCAEWVVAEATRIGLNNCRIIETDGHPVVYGEWLEAGDDKPTLLVYAHYDVQPVDPLDLWESEPFEPTVRDGKLYARGTSDNKCGVCGNLKVIESFFATHGRLPLNLKVIFEGEEESGSPNMEPFVRGHTDLLQADVLVNCDGGFEPDQPRITYAGRGIVAAEVRLTGPGADLHSGLYGGFVHNPLHLAGKIIGSLHDDSGRIQIPGYYDKVRPVDEDERRVIQETWDIIGEEIEEQAKVDSFWADDIASLPERATVYPTLDINGMWGGYQGPGTKTIIPAQAAFKVTMRLVPDQNPREIAQAFTDYVMGFATDAVKIDVRIPVAAWPFALEFEGPRVEAVQVALETTINKRALMVRTGGSIPIMGMFNQAMNMPITGFGFGDGDNIHSPNEFVRIDGFFQAMETAVHIYHNLSQV